MKRNGTIYLGMSIGCVLGGFVPTLWGAGLLSLSSVLIGGLGGFLGIWIGYTISQFD